MLAVLLEQEEGKNLEFKENANSLPRILQTIIAFSNTAGGTIVIGVKDKTKEIVGVQDVLKEEERIANAIADSISPFIAPNFQFYTWRNRDVLIITVAFSPVPYFLKSKGPTHGVYVRLGSTNRIADQMTIAELQRIAEHQSFDELPNIKTKENDIDFELARNLFLQKGKNFNIATAKSFGLLVQHHTAYYPSNGAMLLFGKERQRFFPNAIINCGCFSGSTKTNIIDQQIIDIALPLAAEKIISFIDRNTAKRSEITKLHRIDIPQYPPIVIREALINAIVHADYSVKGANLQIAIFTDRIEITNPGALPFGLSLEKALSGISQLRNRVIGHIFKELGLIEKWGSGFGRMIELCNERGIKQPKFEELDHYFRVTLYPELEKHPVVNDRWQQEVISYLQAHKYISTKEASKLWKVTARTASSRLRKLIENGIIVVIGTGRYDPKRKFTLTRM